LTDILWKKYEITVLFFFVGCEKLYCSGSYREKLSQGCEDFQEGQTGWNSFENYKAAHYNQPRISLNQSFN
jgi:hypothetical protein